VTASAFTGTDLDSRDGFIHLSLPTEVRSTCAHYFKGVDLILARVDLGGLRIRNDWVEKRGAWFPHVLDLHIPIGCFSLPPAELVWDVSSSAHAGFPAEII
jgi:uncharacterized protein (DUF952 family)